jgi:hypothetical protein
MSSIRLYNYIYKQVFQGPKYIQKWIQTHYGISVTNLFAFYIGFSLIHARKYHESINIS